ncbi:phosphopantetheine-binding protein [Streptomyces novaecaesareae]|uniref:phosphopantetheine-binding protein n=1 Tax=Streptomyces novaecaesareae TaxID=68244 RepID=UPI0004AB1CEE|nr:phosphopantetheine-binding protein [Streptomyces novaecaesareae]
MSPVHPAPTPDLLRAIWCELLGLDRVDDEASFFTLSGSSVDALRLVDRVRTAFGLAITVRTVIEAPTVALLAEALRSAPPAPARPSLTESRRAE